MATYEYRAKTPFGSTRCDGCVDANVQDTGEEANALRDDSAKPPIQSEKPVLCLASCTIAVGVYSKPIPNASVTVSRRGSCQSLS